MSRSSDYSELEVEQNINDQLQQLRCDFELDSATNQVELFYDCQWLYDSAIESVQKVCESIGPTSKVVVIGEGLRYFRKEIMEIIAKTGCCDVLEEENK